MYQTIECLDPTCWDAALLRLPHPHILQSWAWGETKRQTGWRAKRLLWLRATPPPQSASADLSYQPANSFAAPYQPPNSFAAPDAPAHSPAARAPQSASADLSYQPANSFAAHDASYQPPNSFAAPYQPPNSSAAPVAAAAILIRRLAPRLPLAVAYVPKGPLLDWTDEALAEAVLSRLEAEAKRAGALFIKIDPDVRSDTAEGQRIMALLARRGWRPSAEQIQFRNTMISDLTRDEDALLAAMKPKWRYNIRLAERRGVIVRNGTTADLPLFYAMYSETGQRDGFLVRPYEYYRAIWERFMAEGTAHLLLAEVEGRPVAGLILFRFGPTAWYFYGASTAQSRELMPNHALQWAAMRWAKAAGCTRYDWWGAPDVLDETDPMWGVYRFKQGFGGEFVPHIGAWDYPTSRLGYWGYTVAMPRVLDLMRRRHRNV